MGGIFDINGLPTPVLNGKSPMEILIKLGLNFSELKIFGCSCYPYLRSYNTHKFQFRIDKYVYLGPSPAHKRHKCLSSIGRIFIFRHVQFNEAEFPFASNFGTQQPSTTPLDQFPSLDN